MVPGAHVILAHAASALKPRLMESPPGSNKGADLEYFLRKTPFQPGEFWCYYFALACVMGYFGSREKLPASVAYTGSCHAAGGVAHSHGLLSEYAATGSIFILPDRNGHYHHAGLVKSVERGVVHTIEGNTNTDGSSNGIGVFEHTRPERSQKYIIW